MCFGDAVAVTAVGCVMGELLVSTAILSLLFIHWFKMLACSKELIRVTKKEGKCHRTSKKSVSDHCWTPINICILWDENKIPLSHEKSNI